MLGQLFELHVQSVEAHAHFVGTQFIGFQRQLEAVIHTACEASGAVAEVLRGLDGVALRSPTITGLRPALPLAVPHCGQPSLVDSTREALRKNRFERDVLLLGHQLLGAAMRPTRNRRHAEDLVQEAMLRS